MSESGAAQRVTGTALVARAVARVATGTEWARVGASVRGPLLTLATAILFDVLARHNQPISHPFPFLLLTVVYSAYSGGFRPGVISALVTLVYAIHFLSEPGSYLRYTPANAYSLLAIGVAVPVTVILVARLKEQADRAREMRLSRDQV